ncbi:MAG TPA: response regulator transcription factor [Candidatus Saccharimonadales bacterium]|jgi:two-component system response regulator MprA
MIEPKAILIEDNRAVLETISTALLPSYNLSATSLGQEGLDLIKSTRPELIILDLNLPDISGLRVCREARRIGVKAPILVLSGDSSTSTKLALFSAGADDYMVKPFSLGELEARLKAMYRRLTAYKATLDDPRTPSLVLDRDTECVYRDGSPAIRLRHKEYAVLDFLIKRAGAVVSRAELASHVWESSAKPWSNSIDVHVKTLRDKVDRPFERKLIHSVHGVGYRLEDE